MFSDPFLEYHVNVWDTQTRVKIMVGDIPWRIDRDSEKCRWISLDDCYISFGGTTPQFNSICPNWFEYHFIEAEGS